MANYIILFDKICMCMYIMYCMATQLFCTAGPGYLAILDIHIYGTVRSLACTRQG